MPMGHIILHSPQPTCALHACAGSECGQPQQPQPLPPQLQRDAFSAAFEAPKKLKQRKKDYLNAKKLKKKGKHISKLEEQHERVGVVGNKGGAEAQPVGVA